MIHIDNYLRSRVLVWASRLTSDADDPQRVLAHAQPLLAWLAEASAPEDLDARTSALSCQHRNTRFDTGPDDDPQRLLAHARELYAFVRPDCPDHDGQDLPLVDAADYRP